MASISALIVDAGDRRALGLALHPQAVLFFTRISPQFQSSIQGLPPDLVDLHSNTPT